MESYILYALLSALFVSLIALSGIIFMAFKLDKLQKIVYVMVSFAVGALLGSAFFIIIPESYHFVSDPFVAGLMVVTGILLMFILEKFIHWKHVHTVKEKPKESSLGYISLVSDALHNFIDGVLIASAWATSPAIGLTTTLSVILHELPQEISDFGILISAGFSKKKAILFNFYAAITVVLGVIFTFWLGQNFTNITNYILPLAAGGFIYLAGSDLIPQLHQEKSVRKNIIQFLVIIAGLLLMILISKNHSHNHSHDTHYIYEHHNHEH